MDAPNPTRSGSKSFLGTITLLYFLSGAVGLLYEVAWFRRLQLVFGVSIFAVGAVAAAFMLGLAFGSRWASANRRLRRNPLATYAWLELGIGLFALVFPSLMGWLEITYVGLLRLMPGHFVLQSLARFVLGFLLLLPPTFMMGATLPALSQVVASGSKRMAERVGWLYAVNTLGGVAGTIVAGFYTLEHLGIRGTIHAGLIANTVVAAGAFLLARVPAYRNREQVEVGPKVEPGGASGQPALRSVALFAAITVAITGLVSMASEVVWTRALVFFVHNSTYAFSSILAVYLLGIGAGAAIGAKLVRHARDPMPWLATVLCAIPMVSLLSIAVYRNLPGLSNILIGGQTLPSELAGASPDAGWIVKNWFTAQLLIFGQVGAVVFLPSLLFGLVFPLALRLAQSTSDAAARVVGRLYAANTFGSVVGTVLGTFVLVSTLGTRGALLLLTGLPVPLALWAIFRATPSRVRGMVLAGGLPIVLLVVGYFAAPRMFYRDLFERRFGKVVWFSEGLSETIAVCQRPDGENWIHYSDGRGASGSGSFWGGWLYADLPLLLHPKPDSALVVCFGTGNTLGAASIHPLQQLDGVELSTEVVRASQIWAETNHHVADNPDVHVTIEDGRNYLLATAKRYDVITEEPPLVHTAGVVNLYSKEFYQLCSDRMSKDGIMAVWLATWELEEVEMRMLVKAFIDVFPHTSIWDCTHSREWVLIGSKQPLRIDLDDLRRRMSQPQLAADLRMIGRVESGPDHQQSGGIESPADLLSLYLKGRDFMVEFAGDIDPVTDDKTVVDYTTSREARANFGLGESITGGLLLRGVGPRGFRSELMLRDFDSVYAFRESVEPIIASYGSYDPTSFRRQVERKQHARELEASRHISNGVMGLVLDYRTRGDLAKSLDTVRHGLTLIQPDASADLHAATAALYHDLGRDADTMHEIRSALAVDPTHAWATEMLRRERAP